MTGEEKPKRKKRRLIGIISSLLSLAALTYIAITLVSGRDLSLTWLSDLFSGSEPVEMADEYIFDVGRDRVFADLGGSLASAGTLGVQVLNIGGNETLRDPFRMSHPAINAINGHAIVFDIGGTAVRVLKDSKIVKSVAADNAILSASINRNGWFCVCTQGVGGFKGVVTVYNDKGNAVYSVSLSSGYVLSAALSPDNKSLAVLNLTDESSRITFYNGLSSETADSTFDLPGELILDIWYPPDGELVAVSTNSFFSVDKSGKSRELHYFSGRRLGAYAFNDDFYSLHLLDYGVGFRGQLVTLGADGTLLGELTTDRELISVTSGGGYLAVLRNDGFSFYNANLNELPSAGVRTSLLGANRVLMLGDGAALATGEHLAVVIRSAERSKQ